MTSSLQRRAELRDRNHHAVGAGSGGVTRHHLRQYAWGQYARGRHAQEIASLYQRAGQLLILGETVLQRKHKVKALMYRLVTFIPSLPDLITRAQNRKCRGVPISILKKLHLQTQTWKSCALTPIAREQNLLF